MLLLKNKIIGSSVSRVVPERRKYLLFNGESFVLSNRMIEPKDDVAWCPNLTHIVFFCITIKEIEKSLGNYYVAKVCKEYQCVFGDNKWPQKNLGSQYHIINRNGIYGIFIHGETGVKIVFEHCDKNVQNKRYRFMTITDEFNNEIFRYPHPIPDYV